MGDELRVEPADLTAKAGALTTETSDQSAMPTAPSAFTFVQSATAQVVAGANTLKNFVASGNAEANRLAAVFNAAARTYKTVDDRASEALNQFPPQPVPNDPIPITPTLPPPVPAVEQPPLMPAMAGGDTDGYMDAKAAAQIIHSGNPGPMRTYAGDARDFASALRDQSDAFSMDGVHWEGTAAEAAGNSLRQHQEWLNKIAEQYEYLATQAEDLAAAQEKWADQHPTVEEIEEVEREMQTAIQNKDRLALRVAQDKYGALYAKSEEVRVGYSADVTGKGLLGVPKPPSGAAPVGPVSGNGDPRKAAQPNDGGPGGPQQPGSGGGSGGGPAPQQPAGQPSPMSSGGSPQQQDGGQKSGGGQPPGGGQPSEGGKPPGGGAPSGGGPGEGGSGGGPQTGGPKLPTDPSLRPAAAGGGGSGSGGGGGGVGSLPMTGAVTAETVAPAPMVGAGPGPSAGSAVSSGAMAGGMGGMAPMHGAGMGGRAAGEEAQSGRGAGRGVVHRGQAVDGGRDW